MRAFIACMRATLQALDGGMRRGKPCSLAAVSDKTRSNANSCGSDSVIVCGRDSAGDGKRLGDVRSEREMGRERSRCGCMYMYVRVVGSSACDARREKAQAA